MNIPKAIENGEQYLRDGEPHDLDNFITFVKLGIEALERIQHQRSLNAYAKAYLLPGETEK